MNPAAFALRYSKVVMVAVIIVVIAGSMSFLNMPRQEDPDVNPAWATVVTRYPGASPEKVERLVTSVLEQRISEIKDIKETTSYSREGVSLIVVHLEDGADRDKNWDTLRQKVEAARGDLPVEADEPEVNTELTQTVTMLVALAGRAYSYHQLLHYAEQVQARLEQVRGVARVQIVGEPEDEVRVTLDPRRLSQYRISNSQVIAAIKGQNNLLPGGLWPTAGVRYPLWTAGEYRSLEDIAGTVVTVTSGGYPVRLGSMARVEKLPEPNNPFIRSNGDRAVVLAITAREGVNVVDLGRQVREGLARFTEVLPGDLSLRIIADQPAGVEERLNDFARNLFYGMVLVILVVMATMGLRNAFIVSMAIPLSVLVAFAVMPAMGVKLHQVSVSALVIALGMLVDNAIVVMDNIDRHLEAGLDRQTAVVKGVGEVGVAVLTATLTTVGAFIPLMLMQGDVGDFIRAIPQVVSLALMASLAVAVLVTPLMSYGLLQPRRPGAGSARLFTPGVAAYNRVLATSLKRPGITLVCAGAALAFAVAVAPRLGVEFFPPSDKHQLVIDVRAPAGTEISVTGRVSGQVEEFLAQQPEIKDYTVFVGRGIPKVYYNEVPPGEASNRAQVLVNVQPAAGGEAAVTSLVSSLRRHFAGEIAGAMVEVRRLEQGPPVGAPIVVRLSGEELDVLQGLSRQVEELVRQVPGTVSVSSDAEEVARLRVEIDPERAPLAGLTNHDISLAVRAATEGLKAADYQEGTRELPVMLRYDQAGMVGLSGLESLYITSPVTGGNIILGEVARVVTGWDVAQVIRYNNQRTVTVRAGVEGRLAAEVQRDIEQRLGELNLPKGYALSFGGENEDMEASFGSLGRAALVAILVIYLLLVIQFNSLKQPLVILSTIPLALVGAVFGLVVTRNPVGFMALLGVVSLSGIVVNNAIVLLEFINARRREGSELREAILEAGRQRFRPIMLTTVTTVGGLLPLTLSGGKLWGPMGWSIIFGLMGSTLLTLVVVPALYLLVESGKTQEYRTRTPGF